MCFSLKLCFNYMLKLINCTNFGSINVTKCICLLTPSWLLLNVRARDFL